MADGRWPIGVATAGAGRSACHDLAESVCASLVIGEVGEAERKRPALSECRESTGRAADGYARRAHPSVERPFDLLRSLRAGLWFAVLSVESVSSVAVFLSGLRSSPACARDRVQQPRCARKPRKPEYGRPTTFSRSWRAAVLPARAAPA